MKDLMDSKKSPTNLDIQVSDFVRVRKPNDWYFDYDEVTEVGKISVKLKSGGRWPLASVSSKTSRSIANRRTAEGQFEEGVNMK